MSNKKVLVRRRTLVPEIEPHQLAISYRPIARLVLDEKNPKLHSKTQLKKLKRSIKRFGFLVPALVDKDGRVIAGHGRILAAGLLGLDEIPTVQVDHLTPAELRAFQIADNRLTELGAWDDRLLGQALKELVELDFDIDLTGFETAESDLFIQAIDGEPAGNDDPADRVPADPGPPVTRLGDLWCCGRHLVYCGDAREEASFRALMDGERANLVFVDVPYNVRIPGNVSGLGKVKHADFVMASGEMSSEEYTTFLTQVFRLLARYSTDGAISFVCNDWRHLIELFTAGKVAFTELLNLCVWVKDNAGMGSLFRSQHELIAVFKNGRRSHRNNVQLGKFGRYRTNVWNYPGANSLSRSGDEGNLLALHSTPKPVALVMDAILDCSARGDIVVDSFLGSGTTLIAAERAGRIARGMELDPHYVDVAIRRYEKFTGDRARHAVTGRLFGEAPKAVRKGVRRG